MPADNRVSSVEENGEVRTNYIIIFLRFIGIRLAFVVTAQILTDAIMN